MGPFRPDVVTEIMDSLENEETLEKLISFGEGNQIEFKRDGIDSKIIAKSRR